MAQKKTDNSQMTTGTGKASRTVRLPKSTAVISKRRTPKKTVSKKQDAGKKEQVIRGAEVSVRQSASPGQILYGEMRVGGVYTFLDTSNLSKAYTRTGTNNSQIVWIARAAGSEGNDISVTIIVSGTVATTTVAVVGKDITVTAKSSAGVSQATANSVIAAVQANASANALVTVHTGEGTGVSNVQAVSQTFLQDGGGTWLHQVITLAAHEITAVDKLFLDQREVTFGASPDSRWSVGYFRQRLSTGAYEPLVFMAIQYGTDTQSAQPDLVAQIPSRWTAAHQQKGCAHVYLIFKWNAVKFPQGLPEVSFKMRGKPVLDTRTSTTGYSNNAALIIADYMTNTKWGMGISWSDIDTTALNDAANVCDETVTLSGGVTEKRYTINGVFDTSQTPQSVLEEMAEAIAGDIIYQGGKWKILPGKWRTPDASFTRADTRGSIKVTTRRSRADTFNSVRGTYAAAENNFEETEFPTIKVPAYIVEDGREIYEDLTLNFVTSNTQAQRIAKIRLAQIRQPILIETAFTLKALNIQIGDVITYTDDTFGWVSKQFEVRDWVLNWAEEGYLINVTLAETAQAIYTWTNAEQLAFDPAPNSSFPDQSDIVEPTNLILTSGTTELYLREDGTVFSRLKVSWTKSTSIYVEQGGRYDIQYKKVSSSTWLNAPSVNGESSFSHILDVQDGEAYDVQIRAVSAIGVVSEWVQGTPHIVVGKTEPPTDVAIFTGTATDYGIVLTWQEVPDLDVTDYEVRVGSAWNSSTLITLIGGTAFTWDIQLAGTYQFLIKARDSSGNYSTNAKSTLVTIGAPAAPIVTSAIDGANLVLAWAVPTSLFAIADYEIAYGATYGTRTVITTARGTSLNIPVDFGGTRIFYVTAIDVSGNAGSPGSISVTIQPASAPLNLNSDVIDNNVKLDWDEPVTGSLPIAYYKIWKGDDIPTTLIGQVSATFSLIAESTGGQFQYFVEPYDTAGNAGAYSSTTALVNNPPDLVIAGDVLLDLSSFQLFYMTLVQGQLLGPVFTNETWTTHFDNNLFTSPQDQIDAKVPYYAQPGPDWCSCQKVHDFGASLPVGFIKAAVDKVFISGKAILDIEIWYSNDKINWVYEIGSIVGASTPFRYVKLRISYGTVPAGTWGTATGLVGAMTYG